MFDLSCVYLEFISLFETNFTILLVSFVVAFLLAFGVGANDVANSFGTSVGSKVLTLKQACILATVFEILGAITMGYHVSATIRTGMIYIELFDDQTKLLMLGYLAALCGSSVWNILATVLGLPVSGTHSIVGSIIGFSAVAKGLSSVKWHGLIKIVSSWFISPVLSGIVSLCLYLLITKFISNTNDSLNRGLLALPLFYGLTIFVNVFSIVHHGPHFLENCDWSMALISALSVSTLIAICVWFFVVPRLRARFTKSDSDNNQNNAEGISMDSFVIKIDPKEFKTVVEGETEVNDEDKPEVAQLFTFLQILTACFGSFAHGGNDVSNAIGPLVAIMMLYEHGHQNFDTPWYILLFGGIGISIGLWVWGRRVIKTMGSDLTKITPSTGFTIEIGAAMTVLLASKIGLPVSTTHCKVGSVVMVGKVRKTSTVNWKLFVNIALAWIITVPFTGLLSALSMYLFMKLI